MSGSFDDVVLDELPQQTIALQVSLPVEKQGVVSLGTNVDQGVSQYTLDRMLDKLMAAAERQRAKQQIPALRHELDGNAAIVDEARVRLAGTDAEYEKDKSIRDANRKKLIQEHDALYTSGYEEWRESGRQGEFQPRGNQASKISGKIKAELALSKIQENKDNEYKVARDQIANGLRERETAVEILTRRIAETEALINGDDSQPDLRGSA
jgi:hypothetical protein